MSSHSVVRLTSPDADAENGERLGTGFLVHLVDGEGGRPRVGVLTACHNLPHHPAPQVETLHVHAFYAPQSRFEQLNVARLLRFDPEEDWALLELGSSADEVRQVCGLASLTLPTLEALRPGDLEFTTLGYPERDRAHPDAGRILASDAPDARARRAITVVGSDHPRAAPGYSGAPLWSTRRTVVGLVRQGVRAGNANRYTALGAGRLLEVVGHELKRPPPPPPLRWKVLAVLTVAVAALAAALWYWPPPDCDDPSSPCEDGGTSTGPTPTSSTDGITPSTTGPGGGASTTSSTGSVSSSSSASSSSGTTATSTGSGRNCRAAARALASSRCGNCSDTTIPIDCRDGSCGDGCTEKFTFEFDEHGNIR